MQLICYTLYNADQTITQFNEFQADVMSTGQDQGKRVFSVDKLISEARHLAAEYRRTTGQPLGISGEIAQHDACNLLDLEPVKDASSGFDAIGRGDRQGQRIQIKGRVIFDEARKNQRIGQLKLEQEWDSVMLVLMDENYETDAIYEALREIVQDALSEQAESNRSKRGAMSVAKFKNVARLVWTRQEGAITDEVWDNQSGT